ncbi:APC family permease [Yinghuangia seranimata]|uniref:APC family permease n=1 Tax=Yinghuangia seranimata TaxID=408067 RepID=UPI00248B9162|nr:APC family permease [Yinghuangia seranimata]MDI2132934.1 APC family permease [Yinghuangia seranimata]
MSSPSLPQPALARRLGTGDAVVVGLGSMIGAGVFAAFGPAARAAGPGLLIGLGIAAVVAYCNATSSARLAARHPQSGGTYVYGRERLGPFWGYLAGWSFVVGKTASCAAMAMTVGAYVWPHYARATGVAAVALLTLLNLRGVQKAAWVTRAIVATTLLVLAFVVAACLTAADADNLQPFPDASVYGVLQSAGLLFFAFAGYARIATLGEEVRDPARTIPRAIPLALGITLVVYTAVAVAALLSVGADVLAYATAPLEAAVRASDWHAAAPVVRVGAAVAALGSLLALILGVSRTTLAMARDGHLPRTLAAVDPVHQVPHHAEVAVGAAVVLLVAVADLRGAIGFSSFGVLVYYAIANASATRLRPDENPPPRAVPAVGLAGCVLLAATLPWRSAVWGAGVLLLGVAVWWVRARRTSHDAS